MCFATAIGDIKIKNFLPQSMVLAILKDVLYVPGLGQNLFSVTRATFQQNLLFQADHTACSIIKDNIVIMMEHLI